MRTPAEFLDAIRARYGLASDNKLALHMGWDRQQLRRYRNGNHTFDDATCAKVAAQLGVAPDYIMACMAAQRAKTPETRSAWERIAAKVAAAVLLALGLAAFDISILDVQSARASTPRPDYTYAPIRRRRQGWGALAWIRGALGLSRVVRAFTLAALLGACSASYAAGDWTPADTGWEIAFQSALALDCLQTWKGSGADPEHFKEGNGILPDHPTKGEIIGLCAAVGLGHYGISRFIAGDDPGPGREIWRVGTVLIELGVVIRNRQAGVSLRGTF